METVVEVSIIVPIKDENDPYVRKCLESVEALDFPNSFEVFVIKGGNRAQARNLGIELATGEIIAFIDSDCVATKNWLSLIVAGLKQNKVLGGIGGKNLSIADGMALREAIDSVFCSYLGSLGSTSLCGPSKKRFVNALACINSAFRHSILKDVGGFDEEFELCEDTNLSYKVRSAGYKLLFSPEICVWHYRRDTIKGFARQFFSYGVGRMRSILTNREYARTKVVIPFLGALIFPLVLWLCPLFAMIVLAVYLTAILIEGFRAATKTKRSLFLLLIPILFIIEHSGYFVGMVYAAMKGKWKRKNGSCEVLHHITFATNRSYRPLSKAQ